eukprot:391244-Hanusia_phi.AAC.1
MYAAAEFEFTQLPAVCDPGGGAARPTVPSEVPAIGGPGPAGHGLLRHWAVNRASGPSPCHTAIFQVFCMGGPSRCHGAEEAKPAKL